MVEEFCGALTACVFDKRDRKVLGLECGSTQTQMKIVFHSLIGSVLARVVFTGQDSDTADIYAYERMQLFQIL